MTPRSSRTRSARLPRWHDPWPGWQSSPPPMTRRRKWPVPGPRVGGRRGVVRRTSRTADGARGATLRAECSRRTEGRRELRAAAAAQGVQRQPTVTRMRTSTANRQPATIRGCTCRGGGETPPPDRTAVHRGTGRGDERKGTIINQCATRAGQVVGAVAQGIGWAFRRTSTCATA